MSRCVARAGSAVRASEQVRPERRARSGGPSRSKSLTSHERKALLIARHQLVEKLVRADNRLRGIDGPGGRSTSTEPDAGACRRSLWLTRRFTPERGNAAM